MYEQNSNRLKTTLLLPQMIQLLFVNKLSKVVCTTQPTLSPKGGRTFQTSTELNTDSHDVLEIGLSNVLCLLGLFIFTRTYTVHQRNINIKKIGTERYGS